MSDTVSTPSALPPPAWQRWAWIVLPLAVFAAAL